VLWCLLQTSVTVSATLYRAAPSEGSAAARHVHRSADTRQRKRPLFDSEFIKEPITENVKKYPHVLVLSFVAARSLVLSRARYRTRDWVFVRDLGCLHYRLARYCPHCGPCHCCRRVPGAAAHRGRFYRCMGIVGSMYYENRLSYYSHLCKC
jgi:hypothetical protein